MENLLDDMLNDFGIFSNSSKQLFKEKAVLKEHPKNENVFLEGEKNKLEYLLITGVAHRYNFSDKGVYVTTGFYIPKSVITPHFVRTNKEKNIFSLQALTDILIAQIPVEELNHLRHNEKEFHNFGQQIIESEFSQTFTDEILFRSASAKERLLKLRSQYPNIENLVPHNIIASYLGITNVSFSRLRNKISRD